MQSGLNGWLLDNVPPKTILDVQYRAGGILPSEMLLFVSSAMRQGCDVVIESGRSLGYSTRVLAKFVHQWRVESHEIADNYEADIKTLEDIDARRVHLWSGDGRRSIPLAVQQRDARIAVLLDGPKGEAAFRLMDEILPKVALCAIHDCHATREDGTPNPARSMAEDHGGLLVEGDVSGPWHWMDRQAVEVGGYASRDEMVRYGYTLAMFKGGAWR